MGFVGDKVALGQAFSEYFGFPCQFSFHRTLHIHLLPSGAGTIGQLVADVQNGLNLTPRQESNKKIGYPARNFVTNHMYLFLLKNKELF
jgi:hypothetical protein